MTSRTDESPDDVTDGPPPGTETSSAEPSGSVEVASVPGVDGVVVVGRDLSRLSFWRELAIIAVFWVVYSWTRNQFGSNRIASTGFPRAAFHNAERVIRWEKAIGTFHEATIQGWFLTVDWFITLCNIFYGTAHFLVTIAVFVALFVKRPDVFRQWRNTFMTMTALAMVGFAFFPLMPPRLLDEPCPWEVDRAFGGQCMASDLRGDDGTFGFVDTLAEYGGLWSFDSDTMSTISNQYAAMPSLHIGWSVWCALASWSLIRNRWARAATLLYPLFTLFTIIVTGNHFWLDGVGGLIAFGLGVVAGWKLFPHYLDRSRPKPTPRTTSREVAGAGVHVGGVGHDVQEVGDAAGEGTVEGRTDLAR